MRTREYLSPSAIATFKKDKEEFYTSYLSDVKLPREPQTEPMSIGSSFDAHVKSYLHDKLFGTKDPAFELTTIFEAQVEPHNRDYALVRGRKAFQDYEKSGALNDLFIDLSQAVDTPRFEFEVRGGAKSQVFDATGLVLLGKPDCYYHNKEGHPVILDWKCNGHSGNSNVSPKPGYVRLRHCDGTVPKSIAHKDARLGTKYGMTVNLDKRLEDVDESWSAQLAIYGWVLGEEVGSEFLTCIDQIVAKPTAGFPILRVAEHRTWVSPEFQLQLLKDAKEIWDVIKSDHIFRELSFEDSKARCETLDHFAMKAAEGSNEFGHLLKTNTWYSCA